MMMETVYWVINVLADYYTVLFVYLLIMGAKTKYSLPKTILMILPVIVTVMILIYPLEKDLRDIFELVGFIPIVFFLGGKKRTWLALYFPNIIIVSIIQAFVPTVKSITSGWVNNYHNTAIVGVLALTVLVVIYFVVPVNDNEEYSIGVIPALFFNGLALCMFFVVAEIQMYYNQRGRGYLNKDATMIIHNAMLATCILLCCLAFYLTVVKRRLNNTKRIADENEFLLKIQNEQMETVINSEEKLHAFKHDLISHLNALSAFAEEGDISKVKDYCDTLLKESASFKRISYTGNPAIDGVLGQLKSMADEKGIDLDIKMTVHKEKKISDYDLCILISNILKNAIEANQDSGRIEIKAWPFNENLCIISTNTTTHPLEYKRGKLLSTKRNYKATGYGMRNIQAVIDKYDGDFQIKTEGNLVKVEALV